MSLRALAAEKVKVRHCRFMEVFESFQDDDDRDYISEQLALPNRYRHLASVLADAEHRMAGTTIAAHAKGHCHCPEGAPLKGIAK